MKVHTAVGFTEVPPKDLARLGRDKGVTSGWDLGSGRIEAEGALPGDRGRRDGREGGRGPGVDVVAFSGDKLLGGPQAGLSSAAAPRSGPRKSPVYRALRLDKVALSGLEATLELLLAGHEDELPARKHMHLTRAELRPVAARIASTITALDGFEADVVDSESQPGAGRADGVPALGDRAGALGRRRRGPSRRRPACRGAARLRAHPRRVRPARSEGAARRGRARLLSAFRAVASA